MSCRPDASVARSRIRARASVLARSMLIASLLALTTMAQGQSSAARPGPPSAREADERLALWLERQGLDRLLGDLLAGRLERESSDLERRDLAERLAAITMRRLRAGDMEPDEGTALTSALRPLLPSVDADELALELLRARYRREEKRLERLRLGHPAQGEDAAAAVVALRAVAADAERVRRNFEVDLKQDDRQLDRSVGLEAESLLDAVDRKRLILDSTKFVQAWANLHLALLAKPAPQERGGSKARSSGGESNSRARAAQEIFLALLDTGVADPTPADVSVDRRAEEPFASAVLGAAIARTLLEGGSAGSPWFALLGDSRTAATVRRSAPGWRLLSLVLSGEFPAAKGVIDELASRGSVPAAWLRIAVLACAENAELTPEGAAFVQSTLAQLAAQEELAEVVELSERLPDSAIPRSGFVAGYIRGLRAYQAARTTGGGAGAFRDAATMLLEAVRERDASGSPTARAAAQQLAAWCLVGAGDHAQASSLFEEAAESLPAPRAAEALWLAAESATRAAALGQGDAKRLESTSDRIKDLLIQRHPASAFATRAEIARIRGRPAAGRDELARLLAVPRGSPAWPEALAAAEELLYRLFRAAPANERASLAGQYLELAREEEAPNATARRTWLRRRIETALSLGSLRIDEAASAVASLRARGLAGEFALDDIDAELRLRDLQVAALQGRLDDAGRMLAELEASAPGTPYASIAKRSIFVAAQQIGGDRAKELVVDLGSVILAADAASMDESSHAAIAMAVGRAALELPAAEPTSSARIARALEAMKVLRERRPNDSGALELLASLAERQGDSALALDSLRALVAGLPAGEPAWFDARLRHVKLLAKRDPASARAVLDQHHALVPDWGPEPWGRQLEALDREVPRGAASDAPGRPPGSSAGSAAGNASGEPS